MAHPTVPTRPPASAFLLIDSKDRDQRSSLTNPGTVNTPEQAPFWPQPLNDFTIQKRQPFVAGYFHRIGVTEFRMEWVTPNINQRNNKLIVEMDNSLTEAVVRVPEGFYTPNELAAALDAALTTAVPGETWNVTYDDGEASFNITTVNNGFTLKPYIYPTIEQTKKGLYFMINWALGTGNGGGGTSKDQSGQPISSLSYTSYIDVCSSGLTQYQDVKDNGTNEGQAPGVLLRVYLGNYTTEGLGDGGTSSETVRPGCRPCVIHRIYNVPKYSKWSPGEYVNKIDIQLRDDTGNLLYVPGDYLNTGTQFIYAASNSFQMTVHCSEN